MDFSLDPELADLQGLARQVFTGSDTSSEPSDASASTWRDLAATDLLTVALPEHVGGSGLGLAGLCVLLMEQGRAASMVPLWPTVLAAACLAEHRDTASTSDVSFVPDAAGWTTLALEEHARPDPAQPQTYARPFSGGWELTGFKACVPAPLHARSVLVSATTDDGPALFLLRANAPGATWSHGTTTATTTAGELRLQRAPGQIVAGGSRTLEHLLSRTRVALAALQIGLGRFAVAQASTYLAQRKQFGRPLGSFQAVQHQLADCWINLEAMTVCLWRAVGEIESGEDSGADHVAKWWADERGMDVLHTVQHLHGGIGVDTDYPLHRAFLLAKEAASVLGGAGQELEQLGYHLHTGRGVA